jgi:hypothetical protein
MCSVALPLPCIMSSPSWPHCREHTYNGFRAADCQTYLENRQQASLQVDNNSSNHQALFAATFNVELTGT